MSADPLQFMLYSKLFLYTVPVKDTIVNARLRGQEEMFGSFMDFWRINRPKIKRFLFSILLNTLNSFISVYGHTLMWKTHFYFINIVIVFITK